MFDKTRWPIRLRIPLEWAESYRGLYPELFQLSPLWTWVEDIARTDTAYPEAVALWGVLETQLSGEDLDRVDMRRAEAIYLTLKTAYRNYLCELLYGTAVDAAVPFYTFDSWLWETQELVIKRSDHAAVDY